MPGIDPLRDSRVRGDCKGGFRYVVTDTTDQEGQYEVLAGTELYTTFCMDIHVSPPSAARADRMPSSRFRSSAST